MTEEILHNLAQRLSELRQHLEQIRTDLNRSDMEKTSLSCHTCGRRRASNEPGWTMRLCTDDELHPFCPHCDRRDTNADAWSGPDRGRNSMVTDAGRHSMVTDAGRPL